MNMTFADLADAEVIDADDAIATQDGAPLPLVRSSAPSFAPGVDADVTADDVRLPRINLVQKSSELAELEGWAPGDIAFAKTVKQVAFGEKARVTFLHLRRQFQENLEYGSDIFPKVFNTRNEVLAAGGSFTRKAPNEYRPIAHLTLLVNQPDNADPSFYPIVGPDGKRYNLAMWTVASTAYTSVAETLISAAQFFLKDGLHKVGWDLTVNKQVSNKNTYYVPGIKQAGAHTPDFQAFVDSIVRA